MLVISSLQMRAKSMLLLYTVDILRAGSFRRRRSRSLVVLRS